MAYRSNPQLVKVTTPNIGANGAMSMMIENKGDTAFNVVIGGVPVPFNVGDAPYIFDKSFTGEPRDDIFNIEFIAPIGANPLAVVWRDIIVKDFC